VKAELETMGGGMDKPVLSSCQLDLLKMSVTLGHSNHEVGIGSLMRLASILNFADMASKKYQMLSTHFLNNPRIPLDSMPFLPCLNQPCNNQDYKRVAEAVQEAYHPRDRAGWQCTTEHCLQPAPGLSPSMPFDKATRNQLDYRCRQERDLAE
jgi:hypothetical protein